MNMTQHIFARDFWTDLHRQCFCLLSSFPMRKAAHLIVEGSIFLFSWLTFWAALNPLIPARKIFGDLALESAIYHACTGCSISKPDAVVWCRSPGSRCMSTAQLVGGTGLLLPLQLVCKERQDFKAKQQMWAFALVNSLLFPGTEIFCVRRGQLLVQGVVGRNTETFFFCLKSPRRAFRLVRWQLRKRLFILRNSWNSLE